MEDKTGASDARRVRLALISAVCLALFAGWALLGGGLEHLRPRPSAPASSGDVGQPAPDFSLERATGGSLTLADYRGQVVLLNFWATWCVPCRAEMPELESAYRSHHGRGFQVVAINVQEGPAEVRAFMSELGLTFPAVLDQDGAVSRAYRARALPSSFLVDRSGVVQYVRVGPLTEAALEEQFARLGLTASLPQPRTTRSNGSAFPWAVGPQRDTER